ncbi:HAMP domain-containing sensor histidine kinase [Rubellicoccus peritrichatus]|uniref:histidine kinase n=1 Tax=Rubellicoccus peritrichatus TaxID=3080537 RepID=A0AAQ3LAX0_9BACT|nr:HAMP domain-containing sensor histidine kinase [Puniceicoccus sp. CR14]WOO40138.1 HAMP domain-containing sensor histidine kinase [Puniceicoccus sp. CR14]
MHENVNIFFDLLIQFTGDGGGHRPGIVPYGIAGVAWLGLFIVSQFKYKSEEDPHESLLIWGFAAAFAREFFMLTVKLLEAYSVLSMDQLHVFFPPFEHALSDVSEILLAAAYLLFLTDKRRIVIRYLVLGLSSVVLVYLATFWWWGVHITANPESKFGQTWCDWVFRSNVSMWTGFAVIYLSINGKGWARNWICVALFFIFLDDFLKLPDMALNEVYEPYFTAIRHALYLTAIPIFAYVYLREHARAVRAAFDSLEDAVIERTGDLRKASEQLETALDQQIQFTADASHELRTPLTIIMNEVYWALEKERETETYKESFETCQIAARHMKGLIESLLELARIDSGESKLIKEDTELPSLCEETMQLLQPIALQKQIKLHLKTGPAHAAIDATKIRQVLINLVSNAVQHSPEKSNIWVRLHNGSDHVTIEVEDQGAGIQENDIPHIFDRFYRSDKARSYNTGGTGLGLAVSKAIANAHNGDLKVESKAGKGSVFTLTLPV